MVVRLVVVVSDPRDPCLLPRSPTESPTESRRGEKLTFPRLTLGASCTLARACFSHFLGVWRAEKSRVGPAAARPLARGQSVCGCGATQPPARGATRASPLAGQHEFPPSDHLFLFALVFTFTFPFFKKKKYYHLRKLSTVSPETATPNNLPTFAEQSPALGSRRPRRRRGCAELGVSSPLAPVSSPLAPR